MAKRKVMVRKYDGNDRYSWALFIDGQPAMTGMSQVEARYQARLAKAADDKADAEPTDGS